MKRTDMNQQMKCSKPYMVFSAVGLLLLLLSGCVSTGKFDGMVQERDRVELERDSAIQRLNAALAEKTELKAEMDVLLVEQDNLLKGQERLNSLVAQTEQQKQEEARKAAAAQAEIEMQKQIYDNLQSTFAQEQQNNQMKIEMMKSGIKVNLANDILFPSGSATLNAQGIEVLKRAAEELKKNTYQTIVAGFTDNVAISSSLKEKYPTNWELAGARAASVVRLLESEGVPTAQLLAISFGENSPVASNESPEERSKNRRIEIVLRPVPVTTN